MNKREFPEKIPSNESQWATLCFDRSPEFKVHSKKGLAHSAIAAKKPSQEIAMYELKDNEWTKVWEYEFPTICECGRTFDVISASGYKRVSYNVPYGWDGSIKDAPVVCKECYQREYRADVDQRKNEQELAELARLQAKHLPHARMNWGDLVQKKD